MRYNGRLAKLLVTGAGMIIYRAFANSVDCVEGATLVDCKPRPSARCAGVLRFLVCAVLLLTSVSKSPGTTLIGNAGGANLVGGILYDVDSVNGSASNPRPTTSWFVDVEFDDDGVLYGLTPFPENMLYEIDPITGSEQAIGPTGLNDIFEGDLGYDPTTDTLYGIFDLPGKTVDSDRRLFTLNRSTGQATVVGSIPQLGDLSAMTFDDAGNLYVIDTQLDLLLEVDEHTAGIVSSTPLSAPLGATAGMTFYPPMSTFFVADGSDSGTNSLHTLDVSSGILTLVGDTGLASGLVGLAYSCRSLTA